MSDDHEHQPLEFTKLTTFGDLLKFKKATEVAVICFACLADPAVKGFLAALRLSGTRLASEHSSFALGAIEVDDAPENIRTSFKLMGIPTTIFYRKGLETARIETPDVAALEKCVLSHLPSHTKTVDPEVEKKKEEMAAKQKQLQEEAAKEAEEEAANERIKLAKDYTIVNAYFGNIDAGSFVDVTAKIRSLFAADPRNCQITATKTFLGISDASFTNTENNKLRVVLEKLGAGRVFSVEEGGTLFLGKELHFQYTEHSGRDGFDLKYSNGSSHDNGEDMTGTVNPYGGLPTILPSGNGGGGC